MAEVLDEIEQASLNAAMRNGIGLTKACHGMNLDVKDVSKFIEENPTFWIELNQNGSMGYKQLLSAVNDAAARKNIASWVNLRKLLDSFISVAVTWGQNKVSDPTIDYVVKIMAKHKVKEEGLTALGISEEDYYDIICTDPVKMNFLVTQNLA